MEFVALNVRVEVAGEVLSDRCRSLNFGVSRDRPEATTFGDYYRRFLPGLKDLNTSMKFNADYDPNEVDDTLFTPWDDGSSVAVNLRPDAGAIDTDNPEYQTTQYVENYGILNVTPGAIAENDVTFKNASGTVTRDVTP